MISWMERLLRDRKGATAIEYGLILAVVVLAMMVALVEFADTTIDLWNNVADKVTKA